MGHKYFIGIDEVGRGPIAGPVTVCAILSKCGRRPNGFESIKDSKKLTQTGREKWFREIKIKKEELKIEYVIMSASNKVIDKIGIVKALGQCTKNSLEKLKVDPDEVFVLLDGSLFASKEYKNQETIIRGDEKEPLIAMASIIAKVSRDWYMCEMAKIYPQYGFEQHKGYGTKGHYTAIKEHGISDLHRRTFLK